MDNQDLGKFQNMLPSRAVLARLALFGTSEETRASANAILKALPPMNERERREYYDETWKLAAMPSDEDLLQSPIGRETLAMLRANAPMSAQQPEPAATVAQVDPEPAASEPEAPAAPATEPVNEHLAALAWPPKSQHTPQPKPEESPRDSIWPRFVAGRPSTPDKSLRPISDWNADSNNDPIY
jgi:hypothetical protein